MVMVQFLNSISNSSCQVYICIAHWSRIREKCNEYETNGDGIVDFSVQLGGQNMSEEITKLNFKVTALDYPDNHFACLKGGQILLTSHQ